ncbi:MAG: hypothetical protein ACOVQ7_24400 [Limnoraphis robusta]
MINLFKRRKKSIHQLEIEASSTLNELLILCASIKIKLNLLEQEIEQIQDSINNLNSTQFTFNPYDPDQNNLN